MVDGIYNQDYRLPNFLVETVDTPLPVPVYFMRSVGSTAAVFFWESFISELAYRAGIDQYAYRRESADRQRAGAARARCRGRGGAMEVATDVGDGARHLLQLLCRSRRTLPDLRRPGRRIDAGRRPARGEARLLRRRSGPCRQSQHADGADPGRHRLCPDDGAARAASPLPTAAPSRATSSTIRCSRSTSMPEIVPIILPSDRPPQGFGEVVLAPLAPGHRPGAAAGNWPAYRRHAAARRGLQETDVKFILRINGATRPVEVDGDTPLLWVAARGAGASTAPSSAAARRSAAPAPC